MHLKIQDIKRLLHKLIDTALLRRIFGLARPYRIRLYAAFTLAVVMAITAVLTPLLIQFTVDHYIVHPNWPMLLRMTILLICVLLFQSMLTFSFTYLSWWLGQNIVQQLRLTVFSHIQHLNLRYFDHTPIGTSVTRTISDVETINDIFTEGVIAIIADMLTIVVVLTCMFVDSWRMSLVCIAALPVLILGAYLFKEGIKRSFTEVRNQVARLNAFLQEHLSGMSVVQYFTAEDREFRKFQEINAAHRLANVKSNFYYSVFFPFVEIISASAIGLLVWYYLGHGRQQEEGLILAFIMFLNMLFRPIRMLADKFNTLQMGMVASERVFKLIDSKDYMMNPGTLSADHLEGDIRFEQVWFAYENEHYVLRDISFHIRPGQTVAIVGSTGSGKSSTISLLSRLYEFQKGNIYVDGHDLREYEMHSLRRHIGVVLQEVFLFSGSIIDNITLRNPAISRETVVEAAKRCGVHDFIMRLPNNYDYEVMERGNTLSLGQRQLLSFVRVVLFNPEILVLDEATSSIDTESEQLLQRALDKLIQGRTAIIIAHRLSTIQKADTILVIEQGELRESGTHETLMALDGYYRKLHDMQFGKEAAH